eukprot:6789748-Prymnesium_polylepis.1
MPDLAKGRVTIYLSPSYRRFPVPTVSYLHEERVSTAGTQRSSRTVQRSGTWSAGKARDSEPTLP